MAACNYCNIRYYHQEQSPDILFQFINITVIQIPAIYSPSLVNLSSTSPSRHCNSVRMATEPIGKRDQTSSQRLLGLRVSHPFL